MSATTVPAASELTASAEARERSHIGLIVLAAMASGFVLGLVLVLGVFGGGTEAQITGGALIALGAGFSLLGVASKRFTDQPQQWALAPGTGAVAVGVAVLVLAPGNRFFELAGWVWPLLLLILVVWSIRGARHSLRSWSRRWLLYPALAVLLLMAVGGAFETVVEATASNVPPASGRTYLVDGHHLYLNCVGTGSPTVVLFNGLGERTPSWALVQGGLSASTRTCVYDRAGEGWSGAGAGPQDGHQLAADLHGLLQAAHVPPPYVLAGHSVGGTYALVYAARYPEQVAGVALIDSSTPYMFELLPDYSSFYSMWRRGSAVLPTLARTGLGQLTLATGFDGLPPQARDSARDFASSPRELRGNRNDFLMLRTVFDQAKQLKSLDGKPLAVLTAGEGGQRGWTNAQNKLAELSTNSVHRTAAGATHEALLGDPRFAALTAQIIRHVVVASR
jgi:pimeloyl-ACP methyl ester carboxylesterase